MRRENVHTGLTGKYMNTQMRIVIYSGRMKRKTRMTTRKNNEALHKTLKLIPNYRKEKEFSLTGWEI